MQCEHANKIHIHLQFQLYNLNIVKLYFLLKIYLNFD